MKLTVSGYVTRSVIVNKTNFLKVKLTWCDISEATVSSGKAAFARMVVRKNFMVM